MDWMTLDQQLERERVMCGQDRRVAAPPPLLLDLWERGHAEGFYLGQLYVLDTPLVPGTAGSYNRQCGDIWVLHDAREPERTATRLLHELAHAARRDRTPRLTIEGYYRDEVATQRLACTLARRWGVPHLLTAATRDAYLALMARRRDELPAAGDLAGSRTLHIADACLDEVLRLAHVHEWEQEHWQAALCGDTEDPAAMTAVMELDRCRLRRSWSLGWGHGEGFEALQRPASAHAARLLHDALTEVARGHATPGCGLLRLRHTGGTSYRHAFVPLWRTRDLVPALAAANRLLLGDERWSAEATWSLYGTEADPSRLYVLEIAYRAPIGEHPCGSAPPEGRLWCPVLRGDGALEAALQLYMRGWRCCTALRTGSLREGYERHAAYESTVPR